jgi:hypothetical protein
VVFFSIEQEDAAVSMALDVLNNRPEWAHVQERITNARAQELGRAHEPADPESRRNAALKNFNLQGAR